MPNYFQQQSPWLGAAQVGNSIGGTVADAMIQVPRAQVEARIMQQQMQQRQQTMQIDQEQAPLQAQLIKAQTGEAFDRGQSALAQAGMYGSEAGLNFAKAGQISHDQQAHVELGMALGDFAKESLTSGGQVSPNTAGRLAQMLAQADKVDPNLMPSIQSALAQVASKMTSDPSLSASMLTGYKVPMRQNVPAGGTSISTMNPQQSPFQNTKPAGQASSQSLNPLIQQLLKARDSQTYQDSTNSTGVVTPWTSQALQDVQQLRSGLAPQGMFPAQAQPQMPQETNTFNPPRVGHIKVKGPNGQTGDVPAGTQLPDGWTQIQ